MAFKEEDFPLLKIIREAGGETAMRLWVTFQDALRGDDEAKYDFALTIQGLAYDITMPGQTNAINDKTLKSCYALFRELASKGHANAQIMVGYNEEHGYGCAKKTSGKPPRP